MSGEFDFIDWIRRQTTAHEHVLVPPGDDLAVLKWPRDDLLIVGVDQVLDTVHFDSAVHSPRDIGRKVMNRNLSDCAAMACLPAAAVATVAAAEVARHRLREGTVPRHEGRRGDCSTARSSAATPPRGMRRWR